MASRDKDLPLPQQTLSRIRELRAQCRRIHSEIRNTTADLKDAVAEIDKEAAVRLPKMQKSVVQLRQNISALDETLKKARKKNSFLEI